MIKSAFVAVAFIAIGSTTVLAQGGGAGGEPPRLGDANPPRNALRNGGVPPATVARRGDDMTPLAGQPSSWNGGWNNRWNNGWNARWDNGSNRGWNSGWSNSGYGGWNNRNISDPSFGSRAGIRSARRTGRCVEDLGYGRFEYCGW